MAGAVIMAHVKVVDLNREMSYPLESSLQRPPTQTRLLNH